MEPFFKIVNGTLDVFDIGTTTFQNLIDKIQASQGYKFIITTPVPPPSNKVRNDEAFKSLMETLSPDLLSGLGIKDLRNETISSLIREFKSEAVQLRKSSLRWMDAASPAQASKALIYLVFSNFGRPIQTAESLSKSIKSMVQIIENCKLDFVLAPPKILYLAGLRSLCLTILLAIRVGRGDFSKQEKQLMLMAFLQNAVLNTVPSEDKLLKDGDNACKLLVSLNSAYRTQLKESHQVYFGMSRNVTDKESLAKVIDGLAEQSHLNKEQCGNVKKAVRSLEGEALWKFMASVDMKTGTHFTTVMCQFNKANYVQREPAPGVEIP